MKLPSWKKLICVPTVNWLELFVFFNKAGMEITQDTKGIS